MASVAICPHCYLQLVVPDGVESDERVECPTCAKEFALNQAVLRAIPEVLRRPRITEPIKVAESTDETAAVEELVAEVVEVEELVDDAGGAREAAVIEEIKTRIEAEIAANGLHPGTEVVLPLELPAEVSDESSHGVAQPGDELPAWLRNVESAPEFPIIEDLPVELDDVADMEVEARIEEALQQAEAESDVAPERVESNLVRPAATTLADLLPPREVREEIDEVPGPSFELPNVSLIPANGATVEIDPNMSFGPTAETEFELDDVDFESMPTDESFAEELDETSEPVFSEPDAVTIPAAPFVLPGIPRARKKRSVVRTLVGTAFGGLVGLSLGYFVLLYALGPEGDLLHVAQYMPSAVLPKSFGKNSTQTTSTQVAQAATNPIDAEDEESVNVPAGYTEETPAPAQPAALDEPAGDDRYGSEPLPLDEPAAEPIADVTSTTTVAPLPLRGPTFTIEQLATALEAGTAAQASLVTGDLSDASVRRTKGMSYAKLCDLAEALTFVDRSSPSVESEQAIESADRLFRETLADAHTRSEIARIAQIWIDSPHRGHGGIFLAGTLSGGQIAGDVYEYELATEDGSKLTLLMREPLDPSVEGSEQPVGIVGSIVDNPADEVVGYQGTAKRAIWVTRPIPLD